MMSKKSRLIITAVATFFCFLTITWLSCTKPSQPLSCDGFVCENGGHCYLDTLLPHAPYCSCPTGYEGVNCATAIAAKFIGTWDVRQHTDWSDIAGAAGGDIFYQVETLTTPTKNTFFISNFDNVPNYYNVVCNIDSLNSNYFRISPEANLHMTYDRYQILGGDGNFEADGSIFGHVAIRYVNSTSNFQRDSLAFYFTPRH